MNLAAALASIPQWAQPEISGQAKGLFWGSSLPALGKAEDPEAGYMICSGEIIQGDQRAFDSATEHNTE